MRKNLLIKAEQNIKTGVWAEKNEFFDTAMSRFYYALYQKILYILKERYRFSSVPREDPHNYTIELFEKNILNELEDDEKTWITFLRKLKKYRVYADYEEDIILSKNDFNMAFKVYYKNISEILEKFISRSI